MRNYKTLAIISVIVLFIVGLSCALVKKNIEIVATSEFPMAGTYAGILPCADCEGIQALIVLTSSYEFTLQYVYVGKSDETFKYEGKFVFNEAKSTISLLNVDSKTMPTQYVLDNNKLAQLNIDGKVMTGTLSHLYVLEKQPLFVERYWKLTEIAGREVTSSEDLGREAYIIFKAFGNRVVGNSGCNSFFGDYSVNNSRLLFSKIGSTKMACLNNSVEKELFQLFSLPVVVSINSNLLFFLDDEAAILAKFEWVE